MSNEENFVLFDEKFARDFLTHFNLPRGLFSVFLLRSLTNNYFRCINWKSNLVNNRRRWWNIVEQNNVARKSWGSIRSGKRRDPRDVSPVIDAQILSAVSISIQRLILINIIFLRQSWEGSDEQINFNVAKKKCQGCDSRQSFLPRLSASTRSNYSDQTTLLDFSALEHSQAFPRDVVNDTRAPRDSLDCRAKKLKLN